MSRTAAAIAFIKERLKYKATRRYVAGLTGRGLSELWRQINETESSGMPHRLYCGNIDTDVLRAALLREISYNPLRFGRDYSHGGEQIIATCRDILTRFADIFPKGIRDYVYIIDVADPQYRLLCDIRDCFQAIARQNTADFKLSAYRDEIVDRFARDMHISMDASMRGMLHEMTSQTADRRKARHDIASVSHRISVLEEQIKLHSTNDRQICLELQDERDTLKHRLDALKKAELLRGKNRLSRASSFTSAVMRDDDSDDAAEREAELLRTLTPEHSMDETFHDYMEKMTGIRLHKASDDNQH